MNLSNFKMMLSFIPESMATAVIPTVNKVDGVLDLLRKYYANHREINLAKFENSADVLNLIKTNKNTRITLCLNNMDVNREMCVELLKEFAHNRNEYLNKDSRIINIIKNATAVDYWCASMMVINVD